MSDTARQDLCHAERSESHSAILRHGPPEGLGRCPPAWRPEGGRRGEGALHVSRRLPAYVYEQLCAESRDEDGNWQNERRVSNEVWDLAVYRRAAWIKLGGERIDWDRPPAFA